MHAAAIASESIEFRADSATVDFPHQTLELDGSVQLTCLRYRLVADRLRIHVSDREIGLDGPATLALCPCVDTPVTVAFDAARIRKSGDLLLRGPSLRFGGIPLLWLPYGWLRSPEQVGLLPPRVAWRASDGLLLGAGLHLPFASKGERLSSLDIYVSGYIRGGIEIAPSLVTPSSETHVRADFIHGDLVTVQSRGLFSPAYPSTGLRWQADFIRGSRTPRGIIAFNDAIRVHDFAQASLGFRPWHGLAYSAGVEGYALRGSDGPIAYGPAASLAIGDGLGEYGVWSVLASSRYLTQHSGKTVQVSRAHASLALERSIGPFAIGMTSTAAASVWLLNAHADGNLWASTRLRSSVPLARNFEINAQSPLHHVLEPFVSVQLSRSLNQGQAWRAGEQPWPMINGSRWLASGGLRSSIGPSFQPVGVEVEVSGGWLGDPTQFPSSTPTLLGTATGSSKYLAVGVTAAAAFQDSEPSGVALSRLRVGPTDAFHMRGSLATRSIRDPVSARVLTSDGAGTLATSWLDRAGTSSALDAVLPLPHGYTTLVGIHTDLARVQLLEAHGGVTYQHPCKCIGARLWVARRLDREGIDGWLSLDLAPP